MTTCTKTVPVVLLLALSRQGKPCLKANEQAMKQKNHFI